MAIAIVGFIAAALLVIGCAIAPSAMARAATSEPTAAPKTKLSAEIRVPVSADEILEVSGGGVSLKASFSTALGSKWEKGADSGLVMFYEDKVVHDSAAPIIRARTEGEGVGITYKERQAWDGGLAAITRARARTDSWLTSAGGAGKAVKAKVEVEFGLGRATLSTSFDRSVLTSSVEGLERSLNEALPVGIAWDAHSARHTCSVRFETWSTTWTHAGIDTNVELEVWSVGAAHAAEVSFKKKLDMPAEGSSATSFGTIPLLAECADDERALQAALGKVVDTASTSKTEWAWSQNCHAAAPSQHVKNPPRRRVRAAGR